MTKADRIRITKRFKQRQARRQTKKAACLSSVQDILCFFFFLHYKLGKPSPAPYKICFSVRIHNACLQVYYTRSRRADGKSQWTGGKDLASSAEFTRQFCESLFHCWMNRPVSPASPAETIHGSDSDAMMVEDPIMISSQSEVEDSQRMKV